MKPKRITPRNIILLLVAFTIVALLARWGSLGFPIPGTAIPSTSGKLVVTATKGNRPVHDERQRWELTRTADIR